MMGQGKTTRHCISFWLIIVLSCLLPGGLARLCDSNNPITQKAYVGPYVLDFPMVLGRGSHSASQPSRCTFKIQTYRKDYVIQLQFEKTSLSRNKNTGVCQERIIVYDGPTTASRIIASFCDGTPEIVTSSDEALVVFSPGNKTINTNVRVFTMKYKAVVRHRTDGDKSHVLRLGFGSFIGAIAFIAICSAVCRKYKKAHPDRSFFQFGRSRTGSTVTVSTSSSSGGSRIRGAQRSPDRPSGDESLRMRITGFFEAILIKLTPARYARESDSTTSTENSGTTLTPAEQLRRAGQAVHLRSNRARYSTDGGRASSLGTASGLEFGHVDVLGSVTPENIEDHVIFGYQNVPSCSFTSDPAAVKPPTYEEVVNNINPLYLYHHPGTYSNPVFSLKDEAMDPTTALSPPPPYSEVPLDPESTSPRQGHDLLARNRDDLQNVDQGQVSALSSIPPGTSVYTPQGACSTTWAQARVPTAPGVLQEAQNSQANGIPQGESADNVGNDGNSGKDEPIAATDASCDLELVSDGTEGSCSNSTSTSAPIAITSSCPGSPPRSLLSIAASSPCQSVTAESQDSSSINDLDEVGGARRREAARDTDVTVGVGGARVHMTADSRLSAPLTPVYLSQDSESLSPRGITDTKIQCSQHT